MEILRIEPTWSSAELVQGARTLVESNRVDEGLVRITLTAGERRTVRGGATITTRGLPEVPPQPSLHIAASARRISGPMSQAKSLSRAVESAAQREAEEEGAFDAILRNEKGRVVETTARNLFRVANGSLRTPPTYDGALPGVTRAAVLEIAARIKVRAREAPLTVEQLRASDEIFATGSGVGVLGIASVDGRRYLAPGPVTERIRAAYAGLLETDSKW